MSRRNRSLVAMSAQLPAHKISDKSKLLWERYYLPMQGAAQALNAAVRNAENIIGSIIIEAEGFSPETHQFDFDRFVIIPRPKPKGGNPNGTVDE